MKSKKIFYYFYLVRSENGKILLTKISYSFATSFLKILSDNIFVTLWTAKRTAELADI